MERDLPDDTRLFPQYVDIKSSKDDDGMPDYPDDEKYAFLTTVEEEIGPGLLKKTPKELAEEKAAAELEAGKNFNLEGWKAVFDENKKKVLLLQCLHERNDVDEANRSRKSTRGKALARRLAGSQRSKYGENVLLSQRDQGNDVDKAELIPASYQ